MNHAKPEHLAADWPLIGPVPPTSAEMAAFDLGHWQAKLYDRTGGMPPAEQIYQPYKSDGSESERDAWQRGWHNYERYRAGR